MKFHFCIIFFLRGKNVKKLHSALLALEDTKCRPDRNQSIGQ